MKNFFLAFLLALLVVLSSASIRQSVVGIGGSPMPMPPKQMVAVGIGGSPMPMPPKQMVAVGIGGSPMPMPPKQ